MSVPASLDTYYHTLGLEVGVSWNQVLESYSRQRAAWQPDRFRGDPVLGEYATRHLRTINEAYEMLRAAHGGPDRWQPRNRTSGGGGFAGISGIESVGAAADLARRSGTSSALVGDESVIGCASGADLLRVSPGEFTMGDDRGHVDARPAHRVRISTGYWMSQHPVTNAQYRSFLEAAPACLADLDAFLDEASDQCAQFAALRVHCTPLTEPTFWNRDGFSHPE